MAKLFCLFLLLVLLVTGVYFGGHRYHYSNWWAFGVALAAVVGALLYAWLSSKSTRS